VRSTNFRGRNDGDGTVSCGGVAGRSKTDEWRYRRSCKDKDRNDGRETPLI
jgi:hypothetical protein